MISGVNGLTEIVIRFFDLLEAEGRQLQRSALLTVRMAALLVLGLIFGAVAVFFLVAALYQALVVILHPAWVLCIMALVCAGIAGGLLWLSLPRKKQVQEKKPSAVCARLRQGLTRMPWYGRGLSPAREEPFCSALAGNGCDRDGLCLPWQCCRFNWWAGRLPRTWAPA